MASKRLSAAQKKAGIAKTLKTAWKQKDAGGVAKIMTRAKGSNFSKQLSKQDRFFLFQSLGSIYQAKKMSSRSFRAGVNRGFSRGVAQAKGWKSYGTYKAK